MDTTRPGRSKRTLLVYLGLLVFSVLAIAWSYDLEHTHLFWSHMVRDIGISGIVGFILAMTFEQLSAAEFRRLTEEERAAIKKDVFYYALGHNIPEAIRKEINAQILESDFIREDFILDFELEVIKDSETGESYMRTICTMAYKVKKLTEDPPPFPFDPGVDKSPTPSLAHETKFNGLRVTGSKEPFDYDEQRLKAITQQGKTEITLKLDKSIVVLDNQPTEVELKYQTVRFLKRGHLDFMFTTHTCDLDLTVRVLDPNIKVFASAPVKDMLQKTIRNHPESGIYNWKIDRPLLAYQGIKVTWLLEQPAVAGTAAVGPQAQAAIPATLQSAIDISRPIQPPIPPAKETLSQSRQDKPNGDAGANW